MTNENFFKHDDKAYAENLNDALLIANAFDYQVPVNIPGMYNNNHYPNDNNIHKVGVADVTIVSSGSLSIGDTSITNNSNTSQVIRLRVYPNFNNFFSWKDISWTATGAITIDICDAGTTTSLLPAGELTNPDGSNLSGVASLRGLKEYDLLITIPANGILNTLSIVFINNWNSQNRVSASISAANVDGLDDIITTSLDSKVDKVTGKDLSSNDFTDEYKQKLDLITSGEGSLFQEGNPSGRYEFAKIGSITLKAKFSIRGERVDSGASIFIYDSDGAFPSFMKNIVNNDYSNITFSHTSLSLDVNGVLHNNGSSSVTLWSVEYSQ